MHIRYFFSNRKNIYLKTSAPLFRNLQDAEGLKISTGLLQKAFQIFTETIMQEELVFPLHPSQQDVYTDQLIRLYNRV